jgi:hypothetical protein
LIVAQLSKIDIRSSDIVNLTQDGFAQEIRSEMKEAGSYWERGRPRPL